jgi:hypothetical protein
LREKCGQRKRNIQQKVYKKISTQAIYLLSRDNRIRFTWANSLKEQCHEIFRLRFFHQQLLLVPIGMPRNDFEFFSNIRGVIRIRYRLPGDEYTGESIRIPSVRQFMPKEITCP